MHMGDKLTQLRQRVEIPPSFWNFFCFMQLSIRIKCDCEANLKQQERLLVKTPKDQDLLSWSICDFKAVCMSVFKVARANRGLM